VKILVVDDEKEIRTLLRVALEASKYVVVEASSGQEGIDSCAVHSPDLVILDLMLPDMDGIAVLERVRAFSDVPVIVLSVRDRDETKIAALDAGADDYLTKPFSVGELLARIRAASRRSERTEPAPSVNFKSVSIDFAAHEVRKANHTVKLTATEFELLSLLARNRGRVLTHGQITKEVWGQSEMDLRPLRVFIAGLRKKLEENPTEPEMIITEPGVGYRFRADFT
jgi:two-component system KDP operon response regulator KdpE